MTFLRHAALYAPNLVKFLVPTRTDHPDAGMAPGTQMNSTTSPEARGSTRGASEYSPGGKMNDARSTTTGKAKGASELSPGATA